LDEQSAESQEEDHTNPQVEEVKRLIWLCTKFQRLPLTISSSLRHNRTSPICHIISY
jgi:hypothetical protein